jgi:hypothetical protein
VNAIDFGGSPYWLFVAAGLALGLAYLTNFFQVGGAHSKLSTPLRWLLSGLRTIAIFFVAALLIEPILQQRTTRELAPEVSLHIDDTQSMLASGDTAYLKRQLHGDISNFIEQMKREGVLVRPYRLGQEAVAYKDSIPLSWQQSTTNLAQGLRNAERSGEASHHIASIVVSDGIVTQGADLKFAAEELQRPVISVLLGDTIPRLDLRVERLVVNPISRSRSATPARVRIESVGRTTGFVRVNLRLGTELVGQQTLSLSRGAAEVDFMFTPSKAGLYLLSAEVEPIVGEVNFRNNRLSEALQVLESRIRVLIVAGHPHPDISALQASLKADARFSITALVRRRDRPTQITDIISLLDSADVLIAHDWPTEADNKAQIVQVIAKLERRNVPLAQFWGLNTRTENSQEWLERLPAFPTNGLDQLAREAQARVTPAWRQHTSYTFDAAYDRWIERSNPLTGPEASWQLRSSATVLATAQVQGIDLDSPLIILGERGKQRSLLVTGTGVWRQKTDAFVQTQSTIVFDQMWQNLIQWLGSQPDLRRLRIRPIKPVIEGTQAAELIATVLNTSNGPQSGAIVEATISDSAGRPTQVRFVEQQGGSYRAELPELPEGSYSYSGQALMRDALLGTDKGQFVVRGASEEYRSLTANAAGMRQLAIRTGGTFIAGPNWEEIARSILALPTRKPQLSERLSATPLARSWGLLVLIVALLSAEWLLRKRFGLS